MLVWTAPAAWGRFAGSSIVLFQSSAEYLNFQIFRYLMEQSPGKLMEWMQLCLGLFNSEAAFKFSGFDEW